ncbi:hypothetical protein ACTFIW_008815 [Dictyostelium discoideum]
MLSVKDSITIDNQILATVRDHVITVLDLEKKFEVSRAYILYELEELFGPDVMLNLYENGLQIYDVESMLETYILMRQLLLYAVKIPVLSSISPQDLHKEATSKGKELSPTTIEKIISSIRVVLQSDVLEITPSAPFTSHRSTIANQVADQMESLSLGTPTPLVHGEATQEAQIREEIASQLFEEKTAHFFSDLEKQYGVHIMLSDQEFESFQPFQLNRTS